MRSLKFKFWNNLNKFWENPVLFNIGYDGIVRKFPCMSVSNIETVQYTELEDEDGVEIYDGDILSIELPMDGFWGYVKKQKIGVVWYESDYGGFIVQWEYSKNQHHVDLDCDIACRSKVLGNRFENKLSDYSSLTEV